MGSRAVSFEEEMMLYAQKFKEKVRARENLNSNIQKYKEKKQIYKWLQKICKNLQKS